MGRRLAVALIVVGALLVAYAAVVVVWRDPVTDLYARWRQERLGDALATEFVEFRAVEFQSGSGPRAVSPAPDPEVVVAKNALRLQRRLRLGKPLGQIEIPELGVDAVFVHGTRWAEDLSRGPGHYPETWLPGQGKTAAIAAHRTTFPLEPARRTRQVSRRPTTRRSPPRIRPGTSALPPTKPR
jgi:sortase A